MKITNAYLRQGAEAQKARTNAARSPQADATSVSGQAPRVADGFVRVTISEQASRLRTEIEAREARVQTLQASVRSGVLPIDAGRIAARLLAPPEDT